LAAVGSVPLAISIMSLANRAGSRGHFRALVPLPHSRCALILFASTRRCGLRLRWPQRSLIAFEKWVISWRCWKRGRQPNDVVQENIWPQTKRVREKLGFLDAYLCDRYCDDRIVRLPGLNDRHIQSSPLPFWLVLSLWTLRPYDAAGDASGPRPAPRWRSMT
jgi:hypothetical protein